MAEPCFLAETLWDRLVGLMGKSSLMPGTGLLIRPCNSIHTFFMKFDIDVVYINGEGKVLAVRRGMRPWRMDLPVFGASAVIELPSGAAADVKEGDIVCLS